MNDFSLVVSAEMLEHLADWHPLIHYPKQSVKPGGVLLVTTRSIGFGYQSYP